MSSFLKPAAVVAMIAMAAVSLPAGAQQPAPAQPMPGMGTPTQPGMTMPMMGGMAAGGPMMQAMQKMMKGMAAAPMSGNADQDFAATMMPHHQGAIDMAQYELAHGKDPEMLKLARDVVAAQEQEIAQMQAWQAKHPVGQ